MTYTIEAIKQKAIPILKKEGVLRASIFGSYCRGEATEKSDVDMLISYNRPRSLFDFVGLKLDLEDILGIKVDLVTERALHPRMKDSILKEAIKIYEE